MPILCGVRMGMTRDTVWCVVAYNWACIMPNTALFMRATVQVACDELVCSITLHSQVLLGVCRRTSSTLGGRCRRRLRTAPAARPRARPCARSTATEAGRVGTWQRTSFVLAGLRASVFHLCSMPWCAVGCAFIRGCAPKAGNPWEQQRFCWLACTASCVKAACKSWGATNWLVSPCTLCRLACGGQALVLRR